MKQQADMNLEQQQTTRTNSLSCFFCGKDLSGAMAVNWVAEGPICTQCLSRCDLAHRELRINEEAVAGCLHFGALRIGDKVICPNCGPIEFC